MTEYVLKAAHVEDIERIAFTVYNNLDEAVEAYLLGLGKTKHTEGYEDFNDLKNFIKETLHTDGCAQAVSGDYEFTFAPKSWFDSRYFVRIDKPDGTTEDVKFFCRIDAAKWLWKQLDLQISENYFLKVAGEQLNNVGYLRVHEADLRYTFGPRELFENELAYLKQFEQHEAEGKCTCCKNQSFIDDATTQELVLMRRQAGAKTIAAEALGLFSPEEAEVIIDALDTAIEIDEAEEDEEDL